jgi:uncharacterized protein YkwD
MPKVDHTSKKRHGKHHRQTKRYVKVYAPYLPLIISIIASLLLSAWQPSAGSTLAYATEMSVGGLLNATNSHRVANGVGALAVNSQLNSAAQAKANDMVARSYWSHTTPDGQEPWVFIDNTGYQYTKAGENLAYGFATSGDAVGGWMNSSSHKANMLDSAFSDVGFGFANGANFNGDGEQTVVVAMYGAPHTLPATTQPTAPTPTPAPTTPTPAPVPDPTPTPAPPAATPEPESQPETEEEPAPVNTEQPIASTLETQGINRSMAITGAPWALGAITALLGAVLIFRVFHFSIKLKRALKQHPKLRHALLHGEHFIMHHPLLDSTILGLAILSYTLSRVVGVIL